MSPKGWRYNRFRLRIVRHEAALPDGRIRADANLFRAKVFRPDRAVRPYISRGGAFAAASRAESQSQPPPEDLNRARAPRTFDRRGVLPGVEMSLGGTGLSLDASLYAYWSNTKYT
jgi:hypothetical protein